jgi:hypothetical protein
MPANLSNFISGAKSIAGTAASAVNKVSSVVNGLKTGGFGSLLKSNTLLPGAEPNKTGAPVQAKYSTNVQKDWRVKLSMPFVVDDTSILMRIVDSGGLVFPYTPSISIAHQANYQTTSPVHNNYPFLSYENSKVDSLTITADFYCEDSSEAQYWVAAVHYFRAVTKMKFGDDIDAGAPPPVVKLNGYGDFVFNNIPVVVTGFQMDLPKDVDYIATGLSTPGDTPGGTTDTNAALNVGVAWAPVKSTFTVTLQPLYSRQQQREFSLDRFVRGEYINSGKGYI